MGQRAIVSNISEKCSRTRIFVINILRLAARGKLRQHFVAHLPGLGGSLGIDIFHRNDLALFDWSGKRDFTGESDWQGP